mmetsp:Transcript_83281/g.193446  ORF Transcript_83281/g.193446 Transcript_83281/m.193446 type:complete len:283 (-) Transcript_83281:76-924(-)
MCSKNFLAWAMAPSPSSMKPALSRRASGCGGEMLISRLHLWKLPMKLRRSGFKATSSGVVPSSSPCSGPGMTSLRSRCMSLRRRPKEANNRRFKTRLSPESTNTLRMVSAISRPNLCTRRSLNAFMAVMRAFCCGTVRWTWLSCAHVRGNVVSSMALTFLKQASTCCRTSSLSSKLSSLLPSFMRFSVVTSASSEPRKSWRAGTELTDLASRGPASGLHEATKVLPTTVAKRLPSTSVAPHVRAGMRWRFSVDSLASDERLCPSSLDCDSSVATSSETVVCS